MKKVEIEDLETKELLEKTLEERTHLQQALEELQQQSITEKAQISQLERRLGNLEDVGQKNVEMMETLERVQKDSCEKTQELVSVKDYLEVLKQQVGYLIVIGSNTRLTHWPLRHLSEILYVNFNLISVIDCSYEITLR